MKDLINELLHLERFSKFLSVGLAGMILDNAVLYVLTSYNVEVILAKIISAESAIALMFILNHRITFNNNSSTVRKFLKSNIVRAGGVAVAVLVLAALESFMPIIAANTIGIGVGFIFNYTLESLYTWKVQR